MLRRRKNNVWDENAKSGLRIVLPPSGAKIMMIKEKLINLSGIRPKLIRNWLENVSYNIQMPLKILSNVNIIPISY